jgi:hypothetical protein
MSGVDEGSHLLQVPQATSHAVAMTVDAPPVADGRCYRFKKQSKAKAIVCTVSAFFGTQN